MVKKAYSMQYIPYKSLTGKNNMDMDNSLLKEGIKPSLRLYGWSKPTLTIGRNQTISSDIETCCEKKNIPIIKRITGGRALLHDNELTYCFVCRKKDLKNGENIISSYKEISQCLINAFKTLEISLEFPEYKKVNVKSGYCMGLSTGSDLSYKGKKLVGSAQCRQKDLILQHGSILIDYNKELLTELFDEPLDNLTSLKEIDAKICDTKILCNAIQKSFEATFGVK